MAKKKMFYADKDAMRANAKDVTKTTQSAYRDGDHGFAISVLGDHTALIWQNMAASIDVIDDAETLIRHVILYKEGSALKIVNGAGSITVTPDGAIDMRIGSASLKLKADGSIDMKGTRILIHASDTVTLKGKQITE